MLRADGPAGRETRAPGRGQAAWLLLLLGCLVAGGGGGLLLWWAASADYIYPGAQDTGPLAGGAEVYETADSPARVANWYFGHVPGARALAVLDNPNSQPGVEGTAGWEVRMALPFVSTHLTLGHKLYYTAVDQGAGTRIVVRCEPRCRVAAPFWPGLVLGP